MVPHKCIYCNNRNQDACMHCKSHDKFQANPEIETDFKNACRDHLFDYLCSREITSIRDDVKGE